jgi:hypothetical protein
MLIPRRRGNHKGNNEGEGVTRRESTQHAPEERCRYTPEERVSNQQHSHDSPSASSHHRVGLWPVMTPTHTTTFNEIPSEKQF